MKYVVLFHSESGDRYLLGPFEALPSFDQIRELLPKEESEYLFCDYFSAYELPQSPGCIDFGSSKIRIMK